ncbi:MAG: glycosyl hydrolase [Bacteroidota bacterium]
MKSTIKRTSLVLLVLLFGIIIFILILFVGDKSKGPLQDLFQSLDNGVSKFEKRVVGGTIREERSASLKWFDRYRNNRILLNNPDTVFVGAYDNNTAESYEKVVELEDTLGVKLPIIQFYTAWGSKKEQVFPLLRSQAIYDLGSIPMITWEPWLNDFNIEQFPRTEKGDKINRNGMKAIADGIYDAYIDKWAKDAKEFNAPFFLRLGHEMNDPYRYPWGPQNNKPEDFIAAWRHIFQRFRNAGTNNAIWIWSPHPAYIGYEQYYPGHEYVDWIGIGTLNYGTAAPWSQWWSFNEIFSKCYANLSLYNKPMMITEFGSLEVGGDRAAWYKQALDSLPVKYPVVKSLVFYNNSNDNTTTYKELDWYVTDDPKVARSVSQSLKGWQKIIKKKQK